MPHAPKHARRIGRSAAAAVVPRHGRSARKDLLVGAAVSLSMLVITGVYAASFRYQPAFRQPAADFPRWSALEGLGDRVEPVKAQFDRLKAAVTQIAGAKNTQAETAAVLKKKISERNASATETPATP